MPPDSDVILALLRLAPEGRKNALRRLKAGCKGEWVDAVRYALGADGIEIGKSAPLWVAAARSRASFDDDASVTKAFPNLGPGAGKAAKYSIRITTKKHTHDGRTRTYQVLHIDTTEKATAGPDIMRPAELLQLNNYDDSVSFHDLGTTRGSVTWLATLWPGARDSFFAAGAKALGDNLDWWEAAWHNRGFLEPLLDSDVPPREIGLFMLLCGLAAKEPGEYGLAVDITIQAVSDGRLGTDNLADVLRIYLPSGLFNLTRLAKRVLEVARASELHAYVVMRAVEVSLTGDPESMPRGLGDLLESLLEIGSELNCGIATPQCRSFLERITGSNKAAKIARQLLSTEDAFDARVCVEQAIGNRVARLEEWHQR